jgi:transcriptional/translational regulatory protein YebC/TACO1
MFAADEAAFMGPSDYSMGMPATSRNPRLRAALDGAFRAQLPRDSRIRAARRRAGS